MIDKIKNLKLFNQLKIAEKKIQEIEDRKAKIYNKLVNSQVIY